MTKKSSALNNDNKESTVNIAIPLGTMLGRQALVATTIKQAISNKIRGLNVIYLRNTLGFRRKIDGLSELELEEFILKKAIKDLTKVRLTHSDAVIF